MYKSKILILTSLFIIIITISLLLIPGYSLKNKNRNFLRTSYETSSNTKSAHNNSRRMNMDSLKNTKIAVSNPFKAMLSDSQLLEQSTHLKAAISQSNHINYIVNKGDTLFGICQKYQIFCPVETAVKTVLALNHLNNADSLNEGMTIELPDEYFISGIKYTVQKGDTLFSIAKKHSPYKNISEAMRIIMEDNFMKNEEVDMGSELFIEYGK